MTRRDLLAGAALLAATSAIPAASAAKASGLKPLRKPKALKPGDKVALVAPASAGNGGSELYEAQAFVRARGWEPILMPNVSSRFGYLAGTDSERAADINAAFVDPQVKGILALRGGYGCMRILPLLDEKQIRRNPKVLIGFSDITALLVAISKRCGFVTFHGPTASSSQDDYSMEWLMKAVAVSDPLGDLSQPDPLPSDAYRLYSLHGGSARGRLVGGNLSLLAHMMGTPWAPDLKDSILFLEDVNEAPYRVDRMLTQLIISGGMSKCRGVVVGHFTRGDDSSPDSEWKTADVLRDRLAGLGIPVTVGWAVGHVRTKLTMPLGVQAELDADRLTLKILEPAVS